MMPETVILDPVEVAENRAEFDITPYVAESGPDWGDADIEQYLANAQHGEIPIAYRIPNRTITIPLLLRGDAVPGVTFEQVRRQIQQKVALIQRQRGWLKRTTSIGPVFADIMKASVKFGGGTAQALWDIDADAVLTLITLPEFYGNEIVGTTREVSTNIDLGPESELVCLIGGSHSETVLSLVPALYWRLGNNGIVDQSGNGRDGTAVGGVTIGGWTSVLFGHGTDAATNFDGTDDYVSSGYNPFANGSTRTFTGWAYRSGAGGTIDTLFGSGSAAGGSWVALRLSSGSTTITFTVNGGTNSVSWTNSGIAIGFWHHWALIFNESTDTAELFIDGQSLGKKTVAQAYNASPGNFQIAARSGASDPFQGRMDEVAVFTRALTAQEIKLLYETGLADLPVKGNYPARTRVVISELSGKTLHGLLWHLRSQTYDPAPTARVEYEAEALTPISPAAISAIAGSGTSSSHIGPSGGNEVYLATLSDNWTGVLSTDLAGVGPLTHRGSYRVWARMRSDFAPLVRLAWDVGDLLGPTQNPHVVLQSTGASYTTVDLGEIRLDSAPIGTHRWRGVIQAAGKGMDIGIDKIWLQALDESAGLITAPYLPAVGLTGYSVRDDFVQTAGALTGKALDLGGVWAFLSGDTDDFQVNATNHYVTRTAVSDSAPRLLTASTSSLTNAVVQFDFYHDVTGGGGKSEAFILFRSVNASNYGYLKVANQSSAFIWIGRVIGGSDFSLKWINIPPVHSAWWTLRVMVLASGSVLAWLYPQGSTPPAVPTLSTFASAFATGGTLASGRVGIGDNYTAATALTRYYDNFVAWVPDIDAVVFPNKTTELRFDGIYREHSDGNAYAKATRIIGDLPRLPPAGMEARPVELFVKPSEGDFDEVVDTSISRISAQMRYRPCYLFVAEQ